MLDSIANCLCVLEVLDALTPLLHFTQLNYLFVRSKQTPSYRVNGCRILRQNLFFTIHDGSDVLFNLKTDVQNLMIEIHTWCNDITLFVAWSIMTSIRVATFQTI